MEVLSLLRFQRPVQSAASLEEVSFIQSSPYGIHGGGGGFSASPWRSKGDRSPRLHGLRCGEVGRLRAERSPWLVEMSPASPLAPSPCRYLHTATETPPLFGMSVSQQMDLCSSVGRDKGKSSLRPLRPSGESMSFSQESLTTVLDRQGLARP